MTDGTGIDQVESAEIFTDYLANGCIVPRSGVTALPGSAAIVNRNAVYDAFRRLSQCVRLIRRDQLAGYAVEGGKSILWFRRYSLSDSDVDLFDGIADAIRHTAPAGGWTNEWLLGAWLSPHATAEGSIWHESVYGDWWPMLNRCLTCDPLVASTSEESRPQWLAHIAYGLKIGSVNYVAEAPSGYNYGKRPGVYAGHLNDFDCASDPDCLARRLAFYKSCRVYEPDLEVEAVETVTESGAALVKVTLSGRLHNTGGEPDGAPDSIARDIAAWDIDDIDAEPFRSAENGVRRYLLWQDGHYNTTKLQGDLAYGASGAYLPDEPGPSIIPLFLFTKLVPLPFDDGNDWQDEWDTPIYHDVFTMMSLYLEAMCEGYVDQRSTIWRNHCYEAADPLLCAGQNYDLFDYTREALFAEAFDASSLGLVSTADRHDDPTGFGPMPNTGVAASLFNRIASAVDLLDKVRVMLPSRLQVWQHEYVGDVLELSGDSGLCGTAPCSPGSVPDTMQIAWAGTPPPAVTPSGGDTGWVDLPPGSTIEGFTYGAIGGECYNLVNYAVSAVRKVTDWRFALTDQNALYAIPPAWRDMVNSGGGTLFCFSSVSTMHRVAGDGTTVCDTPSGWGFTCRFARSDVTRRECVFAESGTIDCGLVPPASLYYLGQAVIGGRSVSCSGGAGTWIDLTPMQGICRYLRIPLEDPY